MSLTDVLFNAAGGGVVGSLLHLGTSFFETWRKKKDAEVDIMLLNAKLAAAEKEKAWEAFTASQQGANNAMNIPAGVPGWVASIYALVDAWRQATRPYLTAFATVIIAAMYFSAEPAAQAEMASEVQFGAWTCIFWWMGARYQKKAGK